jgi:MoxR-like ATPase
VREATAPRTHETDVPDAGVPTLKPPGVTTTLLEKKLAEARALGEALMEGLNEVILGQSQVVEHVVTALLADGHVLLEGAPGLGKTQLVRTLSGLIGGRFARIQFTPDLMPSDILGTSLVVQGDDGQKDLRFREGPIFANLVLADEINRATPKTQSALLEAMSESTVSVEGRARPLPDPFFVLATENPIEMEGVFPLPEAQLDRFLLKLILRMPDLDTLARIGARPEAPRTPAPVTTPEALLQAQALARSIPSAPHVQRFAAELVLATHEPSEVRFGAGPRAVQALMACGRVRALLDGRVAVAIDDLRDVAVAVLTHRIALGFEAEARGRTADQVIADVLASVQVPGDDVAVRSVEGVVDAPTEDADHG